MKERRNIALGAVQQHFSASGELDTIREGPYCSLYRVEGAGRVIKIGAKHRIDLEAFFYHALTVYDLPVIKTERLHDCVLLLEDLAHSPQWRLADENDAAKAQVGFGCARWYKKFHDGGRLALKGNAELCQALPWEYNSINRENLQRAGQAFRLVSLPGWHLACEMADQLVEYLEPSADTLTYNDFHYVNLAVSRPDERIITLFDFDHSGRGCRESDLRNVASGLRGEALSVFWQNSPHDPDRYVVDGVLSLLYSLIVASQRSKIPLWAEEVAESVRTGNFCDQLERVKLLF